VTCSLGTIPGNGSATVNIVVKTAAGSGGTTVTNSATTSPGGGTVTFDTHIVAPTPGSASGFVPPNGSLSTGGNNPARITLTGGPGASVTMEQRTGTAFCNGPCVGPATFINDFPGYENPNEPIILDLSFKQPNIVKALVDYATSSVYKTVDGTVGVKVPDCADNPAWTNAQKRAAALRRLLRVGTMSGIANPSPCVDARSITPAPGGGWFVNFRVLYLSGDPGVGRR
jgi:hypothetical protein